MNLMRSAKDFLIEDLSFYNNLLIENNSIKKRLEELKEEYKVNISNLDSQSVLQENLKEFEDYYVLTEKHNKSKLEENLLLQKYYKTLIYVYYKSLFNKIDR